MELPSTQPATAQEVEVTHQLSQPQPTKGLPTESVQADPAPVLWKPQRQKAQRLHQGQLCGSQLKLQSLILRDYRVHTVQAARMTLESGIGDFCGA